MQHNFLIIKLLVLKWIEERLRERYMQRDFLIIKLVLIFFNL